MTLHKVGNACANINIIANGSCQAEAQKQQIILQQAAMS